MGVIALLEFWVVGVESEQVDFAKYVMVRRRSFIGGGGGGGSWGSRHPPTEKFEYCRTPTATWPMHSICSNFPLAWSQDFFHNIVVHIPMN